MPMGPTLVSCTSCTRAVNEKASSFLLSLISLLQTPSTTGRLNCWFQSCPASPLVLLPPSLFPPKDPKQPQGEGGDLMCPKSLQQQDYFSRKSLGIPSACPCLGSQNLVADAEVPSALLWAWPPHPPSFWVTGLPIARSEQSQGACPRWRICMSWVSGDPSFCRRLTAVGRNHCRLDLVPHSPGETAWWGWGFGCSGTAPGQLSGQKYQLNDSAASVPVPSAGSSRAGGCLPAHKPPCSCCWVLKSPQRCLLLVSCLGGGGLGQGAICPFGLGVMGFAARGWSPGSGAEHGNPAGV